MHNMTDVAQQLLVTSDPVISGLIWAQLTPGTTQRTDHGGNPLLKGQPLQEVGDVSEESDSAGDDEEEQEGPTSNIKIANFYHVLL